ncbi:MAG: FHA domain-containing protein [Bdellovibrionales bacterium]
MWILRFLNGPLAGQIVPLTKHSTLMGRAPNCDIKIASPNISKEHTRFEVFDDKVIISDAGSRNGTFLNGVQIRSSKGKSGDRIGMHDIFLEIHKVPDAWANRYQQPYPVYGAPQPDYGAIGGAAYQAQGQIHPEPMDPGSQLIEDGASMSMPRWLGSINRYMDEVVLPGIYVLPSMFEFRWVLAGFMAGFIILVTALSMIPLAQILRTSIEEESQQHALTIATTLSQINRPFLVNGQETGASVDIATSRPGVTKAFIVSNTDGNIIAPASQAGSFPDIPYVHEGRKLNKESVNQIDDNTVVAMVPVQAFNQETGAQTNTHWAVVVYDMSSLAVDNGRVLSLFITTLFIALLLGLLLFYFLYKMVEHPIRSINQQLDSALKEGSDAIQVDYKFPVMQMLVANISSALNRVLTGGDNAGMNRGIEHDRNREIGNLVELMGFAAVGIRAHDLSIAAANQAFEMRIGMGASQLVTMTVNELNDQALKLSVKDLIERVDQNPDDLATNDLEFSGLNFQIVAQAVYGTSSIAYYLIVLLPQDGEG